MTKDNECREECCYCEKPIDESKDNYESIDTYLDGNYEDTVLMHTDCRYKKDKEKDDLINASKELKIREISNLIVTAPMGMTKERQNMLEGLGKLHFLISTLQKKCLCCGEPRDNDGICRDCILSARDGWLEHYWNHVKEGIPNTNCKLCTELKP